MIEIRLDLATECFALVEPGGYLLPWTTRRSVDSTLRAFLDDPTTRSLGLATMADLQAKGYHIVVVNVVPATGHDPSRADLGRELAPLPGSMVGRPPFVIQVGQPEPTPAPEPAGVMLELSRITPAGDECHMLRRHRTALEKIRGDEPKADPDGHERGLWVVGVLLTGERLLNDGPARRQETISSMTMSWRDGATRYEAIGAAVAFSMLAKEHLQVADVMACRIDRPEPE